MASPVDERGIDAFQFLLDEACKGPGPKAEALDALALRPVWLATWEPRAEGYRTLINANAEEALAVFSSEAELERAATRFGWLEADGTIAMHRAIGGDILRHAWTREYAYLVIDIGSEHSLEYVRDELKPILREMDSTGPFRTSRPPPQPDNTTASSSFPPPVEPTSTMYSMAPRHEEKLDRLSDLPTKPHEIPYESEPPTKPRAALTESGPPARQRKSSRPAHKPKSEPPGAKIEEVGVGPAKLGDGGTYGAASIIPRSQRRPKPASPSTVTTQDEIGKEESTPPTSSAAPRLNSDAPTAPGVQALPSLDPGKLKLPAIGPIGTGPLEPGPSSKKTKPPPAKTEKAKTVRPARVAAPSIGDGIKLVDLRYPPDEALLQTLGNVLRGYFEIEWASYCEVARPAGEPSPAVGLRITDNYRDNVTAIIKDLCEASRTHDVEIDILLIDGHDMLRKARERGFVFYPWKPKPFGS
ncbi:MAG: hypothetical protein WCE62_10890 [Polyangiales bacterium]